MANFYVIARQPGAENPEIPTWANDSSNPANLMIHGDSAVERKEIKGVPGAFQLLNLLSKQECQSLVEITEELGYLEDAAVSLPRSVRHNHNSTWVVDDETNAIIWEKCGGLVSDSHPHTRGKKPLGLNARYRFYRYQPGDYFAPHTDGSWPGSRVIDKTLIDNAYNDRWSQFTFLLFLTDDYEGGSTQFYVNSNNPELPATTSDAAELVSVRTPLGGALCFPHGTHPQHCIHVGEPLKRGNKYIIRSDILFEL